MLLLQTETCTLFRSAFLFAALVNGGYTDWTSWSSCSETCGQQSIQMRMRICMNPRPQYGGKDCPGSRFKIRHCTMPSCQGKLLCIYTEYSSIIIKRQFFSMSCIFDKKRSKPKVFLANHLNPLCSSFSL